MEIIAKLETLNTSLSAYVHAYIHIYIYVYIYIYTHIKTITLIAPLMLHRFSTFVVVAVVHLSNILFLVIFCATMFTHSKPPTPGVLHKILEINILVQDAQVN